MKVSFYPREGKMQVRIPKGGGYIRLSTGLSAKRRDLGKRLEEHKQFLLSYEGGDIKTAYNEFLDPFNKIEGGEFELVNLCKKYLKDAKTGEVVKKDGSRIKPNTLRSYEFAIRTLVSYSKSVPKLDLLEFNMNVIVDLEKKRAKASRWNRHFNGLVAFMTQSKFKASTMGSVILILGIIIKHYSKELFLFTPELPHIKTHEKPIVVLPPDFIKKFLNDYSSVNGEQKYAWEVCATIMVTTMRISDVLTLSWKDLTDKDGGLFISKMNKKTGAHTTMALPKVLSDIYRSNYKEFGDIFSPVEGDKTSSIYKNSPLIMSRYKELQNDVTISEMGLDGELITTTKPLYEYVRPHMLRKTAITSMLVNGVSESHVKFASGHSDKSQAFERYRGFIERNFNNEISSYYETFT